MWPQSSALGEIENGLAQFMVRRVVLTGVVGVEPWNLSTDRD